MKIIFKNNKKFLTKKNLVLQEKRPNEKIKPSYFIKPSLSYLNTKDLNLRHILNIMIFRTNKEYDNQFKFINIKLDDDQYTKRQYVLFTLKNFVEQNCIKKNIFYYIIHLFDLLVMKNRKKNVIFSFEKIGLGALILSMKFLHENKLTCNNLERSLKKYKSLFVGRYFSLEEMTKIEFSCIKLLNYYLLEPGPINYIELFLLNGILFDSDTNSKLNHETCSNLYRLIMINLETIMLCSNEYIRFNPYDLVCCIIGYCRKAMNFEKWPEIFCGIYNIDLMYLNPVYNDFLTQYKNILICKNIKGQKMISIINNNKTNFRLTSIYEKSRNNSIQYRKINNQNLINDNYKNANFNISTDSDKNYYSRNFLRSNSILNNDNSFDYSNNIIKNTKNISEILNNFNINTDRKNNTNFHWMPKRMTSYTKYLSSGDTNKFSKKKYSTFTVDYSYILPSKEIIKDKLNEDDSFDNNKNLQILDTKSTIKKINIYNYKYKFNTNNFSTDRIKDIKTHKKSNTLIENNNIITKINNNNNSSKKNNNSNTSSNYKFLFNTNLSAKNKKTENHNKIKEDKRFGIKRTSMIKDVKEEGEYKEDNTKNNKEVKISVNSRKVTNSIRRNYMRKSREERKKKNNMHIINNFPNNSYEKNNKKKENSNYNYNYNIAVTTKNTSNNKESKKVLQDNIKSEKLFHRRNNTNDIKHILREISNEKIPASSSKKNNKIITTEDGNNELEDIGDKRFHIRLFYKLKKFKNVRKKGSPIKKLNF